MIEVEEEELFGKGEVLLNQPIAQERPRGIGKHPLVGLEPDGPQRAVGKRDDFRRSVEPLSPDRDTERLVEHRGINGMSGGVLAIDVEPKATDRQLAERETGGAPKADFEERPGSGRGSGDHHPVMPEPGRRDLDGPERDGIACLEPTGIASRGLRRDLDPGGNGLSAGGSTGVGTAEQLDDRHRGDGAKAMGVQGFQERLGDLGKLVVDLAADPTGEEREAFEEALDVGVFALRRVELEPAGDLGVVARELGSDLAEVG